RPRRVLGWGALIGLACALAMVIAGLPGMRDELGGLFRGPQTPLPYGANTLYLVNVVPWGRLTVDGSSGLARQLTSTSPAIVLPRGRHALIYVAPPFSTRRCLVSVPAAAGDTCARMPRLPNDINAIQSPAMRALDMGDSLNGLAPTQREALLAAAGDALAAASPSGTVRPGEHYFSQDDTVVLASQQLPVALVYRLDPSPATIGNGVAQQVCAPLCAAALTYPASPNRDRWAMTTHVIAGWRVGAAGPVLPAAVPDDPRLPLMRALLVSWDGAWRIEVTREPTPHPPSDNQIDNQTCSMAEGALLTFAQMHPEPPQRGNSLLSQLDLAAESPMDGCVIVMQARASNGARISQFVLYRYGVLLAANAEAARAFPAMARATAGENALARQIARSYGYEA
ncbi:MAG TPA: hypothetical protein VFU88_00170, partial [Ktedonobacterales bacterium]|nr:hypothetical protein [Ktedonobacterales bacterium]